MIPLAKVSINQMIKFDEGDKLSLSTCSRVLLQALSGLCVCVCVFVFVYH